VVPARLSSRPVCAALPAIQTARARHWIGNSPGHRSGAGAPSPGETGDVIAQPELAPQACRGGIGAALPAAARRAIAPPRCRRWRLHRRGPVHRLLDSAESRPQPSRPWSRCLSRSRSGHPSRARRAGIVVGSRRSPTPGVHLLASTSPSWDGSRRGLGEPRPRAMVVTSAKPRYATTSRPAVSGLLRRVCLVRRNRLHLQWDAPPVPRAPRAGLPQVGYERSAGSTPRRWPGPGLARCGCESRDADLGSTPSS
jgi:hypothetical protein